MGRSRRLPAVVAAVVAAGLILSFTGRDGEIEVSTGRAPGAPVGEPAGASPGAVRAATATTAAPDPDDATTATGPAPGPVTGEAAGRTSTSSTTTTSAAPRTTAPAPSPSCAVPGSYTPLAVHVTGVAAGWITGGTGGAPLAVTTPDLTGGWTAPCLPAGAGVLNAVAAHGERLVWAVGSPGGDGRALALRSDDAGVTWTTARVPDGVERLVDLTFVDASRGWSVGTRAAGSAGGGSGPAGVVLFTVDGGRTWAESPIPGSYSLTGVAFGDAGRGYVVGGTTEPGGASFLATADGGVRWASRALPANVAALYDVAVLDNGRVVAVGQSGPPGTESVAVLLTSDDAGETWAVQTYPGAILWSVAARGTHAWAVGGSIAGDVVRTADGGATWSREATATPALEDVSFVDVEYGWALSTQRTCVYVSADGGSTWTGRPLVPGARCEA